VSPVKYELGFYIPEDAILHFPDTRNCKGFCSGLILFPVDGSVIGDQDASWI
jgi:hypothetical protein